MKETKPTDPPSDNSSCAKDVSSASHQGYALHHWRNLPWARTCSMEHKRFFSLSLCFKSHHDSWPLFEGVVESTMNYTNLTVSPLFHGLLKCGWFYVHFRNLKCGMVFQRFRCQSFSFILLFSITCHHNSWFNYKKNEVSHQKGGKSNSKIWKKTFFKYSNYSALIQCNQILNLEGPCCPTFEGEILVVTCWWSRNLTIAWDVQNPVHTGINYQPSTGEFARCLPSTVPFFNWPDKKQNIPAQQTSNRRPSAGHIWGGGTLQSPKRTPRHFVRSFEPCHFTAAQPSTPDLQLSRLPWSVGRSAGATHAFVSWCAKGLPPQKSDG